MIKVIEKDILTIGSGVICHQVNAQGVMGSGIAKSIRDKWPKVYFEYKKLCDFETRKSTKWALMGKSQVVEIDDNISVVNLFGQFDFRKNIYDTGRYTEYGSFARALETFSELETNYKNKQIYFPHGIGACRGGGDPVIISQIISAYFPNAIYCKLPE